MHQVGTGNIKLRLIAPEKYLPRLLLVSIKTFLKSISECMCRCFDFGEVIEPTFTRLLTVKRVWKKVYSDHSHNYILKFVNR